MPEFLTGDDRDAIAEAELRRKMYKNKKACEFCMSEDGHEDWCPKRSEVPD